MPFDSYIKKRVVNRGVKLFREFTGNSEPKINRGLIRKINKSLKDPEYKITLLDINTDDEYKSQKDIWTHKAEKPVNNLLSYSFSEISSELNKPRFRVFIENIDSNFLIYDVVLDEQRDIITIGKLYDLPNKILLIPKPDTFSQPYKFIAAAETARNFLKSADYISSNK